MQWGRPQLLIMKTRNVPRSEYPRPQFRRAEWQTLNGTWEFAFDDENVGLVERWFDAAQKHDFPLSITVPFVYQSELSGLGNREFHNVLWYRRSFQVPQSWAGRNVLLHFGAVDYRAWVWVNGQMVAQHEGGHTPFHADITPFLAEENEVVVRVEDIATDRSQPRGKQYWKEQPEGIFYTGSSGIWQPVWLEPVAPVHLERVRFTPRLDEQAVEVHCYTGVTVSGIVELEISFEGKPVASAWLELKEGEGSALVALNELHLWSPQAPNLYDVTIRLDQDNSPTGEAVDEVHSYFGMREVAISEGRVLLNGEPYTMKLVLDQGYYPDGLLTPPTDAAIRRDVELVLEMGFNGVRKHQKVEDPRYLYWADRLGLLVWGEMANSYHFSDAAMARLMAEWQAVVERDYNHPSVVAWVPLNESWGVPRLKDDARQSQFLLALYYQTKAMDPTRPVMANDGWEHVHSDLCTVHDYCDDPALMAARYSDLNEVLAFRPSERHLYVPGFEYQGQPIFVTEFGGVAFRSRDEEGWGYSRAANAEEFLEAYAGLVGALLESELVQGFCYTQFCDVEQEINGLLTYDRQPKVPLEKVRAVNEGRGLAEGKPEEREAIAA